MPSLSWIGKDAVLNHHLDVPYRVLEKKYTFGSDDSLSCHSDSLSCHSERSEESQNLNCNQTLRCTQGDKNNVILSKSVRISKSKLHPLPTFPSEFQKQCHSERSEESQKMN